MNLKHLEVSVREAEHEARNESMKPSARSLSIGLLGLALGAYLLYRFLKAPAQETQETTTLQDKGEQRAALESSASGQEDTSTIKADIGRLQYQLSLLRQQVSSTEARNQSPEASRNADDTATKDPPGNGMQAYKNRMTAFESTFRSEPEDPTWSATALSSVQELLNRDETLRAGARHLECRSSICRIEVSDNGSGAINGSIMSMAANLMHVFPSIVGHRVDEAGGKATLVYYMLRTPYSPDSAER